MNFYRKTTEGMKRSAKNKKLLTSYLLFITSETLITSKIFRLHNCQIFEGTIMLFSSQIFLPQFVNICIFFQTIKDLRDLLETHQRDQRLVEMGLGQVRGQVLSQEQKRGCRFYEGTPLTQQGVNCLLKSIEKCIQALDTDVELKNDQIKEVHFQFCL